jgi:hypothetical protein
LRPAVTDVACVPLQRVGIDGWKKRGDDVPSLTRKYGSVFPIEAEVRMPDPNNLTRFGTAILKVGF